MNILLDIVGSLFVRGSMIAVMLTLTTTMNDALYRASQHANTKEHIRVVGDIIYDDVSQAGYNHTGQVFSYAYSSDFMFYGDVDDSGTSESVRYYTVADQVTGKLKLYRLQSGQAALELGKNFTSVAFQYYTSKNKITTDPLKIKSVRVNLVESVEGVTEGFTTATKEFKIYPSNL
jgi:hypothetical protein